jgi:hypothetical protein
MKHSAAIAFSFMPMFLNTITWVNNVSAMGTEKNMFKNCPKDFRISKQNFETGLSD